MSADLMARVERYLIRHKMSSGRFSSFIGHDQTISSIRGGRKPKPEMIAKIEAFMAGPVPPRLAPIVHTGHIMAALHGNPELFANHARKGSAKLLARMLETGQCAPGLAA